MIAASDQNIPAIGISSLERGGLPRGTTNAGTVPTANSYALARIDGVSPDNGATTDRINVRNGLYTFVGEATMQSRGDLSANQEAIKDAIVTALTASGVCANPGPTTSPDGNPNNGTGCETKWTRNADPLAKPITFAGEL
jgi:hypothetical protein